MYFGDMKNAIFNTAVFFKNVYEDQWITDDFDKQMIQDVDKSIVLDNGVIDSPVLGKIPPERLSGGVKTLILIYQMPDKVFNASACGDNCAKWLLKMAEMEDRTVNLRHLMDFGSGEFSLHILNTDQIVHSMKELVPVAGPFV
ncbi:MAG: DUF4869 domain-containing protein [Megasphaera sp.]|uniref:DUF4869 domain-containing protein n=2 Tax=Megasphaera sp. TaxID=2023260 RepID=UPI0025C5DF77|nr:DUF4869 domain-containing protein [Megasphaera sp.]MCI7600391.1 DUF4869 domain-containing protein [Megasphaera sp.]